MIILQGITEGELLDKIEVLMKKILACKEQVKTVPPFVYLTRKEVANMLRVSLPTLHDYTNQGFVHSYKIGNRVLYKSREVNDAIHGEADILTKKHKKYR
jgi:excisionase family DNA binding protein